MRKMETVGRDYLAQFPTREWWDRTPFERIYGEKRMPQAAGFIASTAPNAAPRENLQTASEYLRRAIRGEPILQPEFRVGENAVFRQPGTQLGMEQSRQANLLKAARGDIDQLQRDKVREEAAAIMGDPAAFVGDRHWARIAEDPNRGIFTNAQEGVLSSKPRAGGGSDYQSLKGEVGKGSETAGRDIRDFSADVWTGIRETIKNTNELFGTKFKPGSITGESKSYADHMEELIAQKAEKLGMSPGEMEARLGRGDDNLLSYLLASTPALYEAYRQWQAPLPEPAPSASSSGPSQSPTVYR